MSKSPQNRAAHVEEHDGLKRIVLDNGRVRAAFLPQLGGKMCSFVNLETGREFLRQPGRPYSLPAYGDTLSADHANGFDECLPTIAACAVPGAGSGTVQLPDHGEVWSVLWRHEIQHSQLSLAVAGTRLPFKFHKALFLEGAALVIQYELQNRGDSPLRYLWSAHPLLSVEPGAEIVLPPDVKEMLIDSSLGGRLGKKGDLCRWPVAATSTGGSVRLDALAGPDEKSADKLYSGRLREGFAGIHFPRTSESLLLRFDPSTVRYLGLWICQGGWPSVDKGHFTAALEPCTGRPDSLAEAIRNNEYAEVGPDGTCCWTLRMELLTGRHSRIEA